MKKVITLFLIIFSNIVIAQEVIPNNTPFGIPLSVKAIKGNYKVDVNFHKTTHLLFNSKIKYVDVGNEDVISSIPDEIENVLRIKANVEEKEFHPTNLTVITDDNNVYTFSLSYSQELPYATIDLKENKVVELSQYRSKNVIYTHKDLTSDEMKFYCKEINNALPNIKHIGSVKDNITFTATNIQYNADYTFIKLKIKNKSRINFEIALIQVELSQKTNSDQQSVQTLQIPIVFEDNNTKLVPSEKGQNELQKIIVFPKVTLSETDIIRITVVETGKRSNSFEITNKDLNLAIQE